MMHPTVLGKLIQIDEAVVFETSRDGKYNRIGRRNSLYDNMI